MNQISVVYCWLFVFSNIWLCTLFYREHQEEDSNKMDTTARRRKVQIITSDSPKDLYPLDVSMYYTPPGSDIPLSEFEDLALERLQLLRAIDQAAFKGHKVFSEDWRTCIKEDLIKAGLKKYLRLMSGSCSQLEQDYQARRADHISHFILRLAYCRSEDLRRWFLNREVEWFKLRFIAQSSETMMKFLKINNLTYVSISEEEKSRIQNELVASTVGLTDIAVHNTVFFKVHFTEACQLVKNRKVYLEKGYAYIPSTELVVCIQSKFRAHLSESLNIAFQRLPYLDDDRLTSLLENLNNTYTGKDYTVPTDVDRINPLEIDTFSKQHFPLCMGHIHHVLRSSHHLKHFCRLQYGLFLKGIGLQYEDAMRFWREEFTKIMDSNKFDKQYAYNFKHQYGKVGNMVNYSPYSCIKIISSNVGPGDHHGCPFAHWDANILKRKLEESGISSEGVQQITSLVNEKHYQIACSKYFEYTHANQAPSTIISHPNQYFIDSMKLMKDRNSKK